MYIHMCVYIYVCVCIYICICMCVYMYVYVCIYVCVCVCVCVALTKREVALLTLRQEWYPTPKASIAGYKSLWVHGGPCILR